MSVLCLSAAALAVLMIDDHHWFDRQQRTQEKRILIVSFLKDLLQLWKVNVAEPFFGHAAPVSSHQSLIHCFSVAASREHVDCSIQILLEAEAEVCLHLAKDKACNSKQERCLQWASRISISTISKRNHMGLKPVTTVNSAKCLVEAVRVEF